MHLVHSERDNQSGVSLSFVIDSRVPVPATPEFVFLKGGVALWAYSIPFFTANVPLKFAADYFRLFEELPQADTGEWTLEELFQRDISWDRVDNEILSYLKSQTRPQFFNALTVALLPAHSHSLGGEFGSAVEMPRIPDAGLGEPIRIGGIQLQFFGSDENVLQGAGKMKWATTHVDAVAVDGQHRLAAIKKFVRETSSDTWGEASVPCIFLIADERVGFRTPTGADEKPRTVSALRSVFIDLNKNARPVSPTRNILLDDLDLTSVCTRSVIGSSLGDTVDEDRIPLPLVDWMTDRNKIEDGPFITTVMLLQDAIARLLAMPDMLMDEDDNSLSKVETWLEDVLALSPGSALDEVIGQTRRCARLQTRLSWLPAQIGTLKDAFDREWRPHIRRLFREYAPYTRVWDHMVEKDLLGPEFINLYVAREIMPAGPGQDRAKRLVEAAKLAAEGAWSEEKNFLAPLAAIDKLKDNRWAFKIVYQRGLLRAFINVVKDPSAYFADAPSRTGAMDRFLEAINHLDAVGFGFLDKKVRGKTFWQGSGLSADDTIEFTNAGAERLRSWIEIYVILRTMKEAAPKFADVGDSSAKPHKTLARLMASRAPLARGMVKLAVARDLDPETTDYLKFRYDVLRQQAAD